MISVIIPTLNEEAALPETLEALFEQAGEYEVIIVDGGSTDKTLAIATADKRVKLIHVEKGRALQMNTGAAAARGEWLVFLHADTKLAADALKQLNHYEQDPAIQAGGFKHKFSGDRLGLKFISWLHNFRCSITKVFYGDQALFVRRELFIRMKGFPNEPILEDVLFGEKLVKYVDPIILQDYVVTDSRKFEKMGVWISFFRVLVILMCHEAGLSVPKKFFANIR